MSERIVIVHSFFILCTPSVKMPFYHVGETFEVSPTFFARVNGFGNPLYKKLYFLRGKNVFRTKAVFFRLILKLWLNSNLQQ